ncbi:MAG: M14 family metallopeptidase [Lachnospiraceae bacterium]
MEKITVFQIPALYRDDFRITGFRFGKGEKSLAIVGSLRGDEYQQIYMSSLLVNRLKKLEAEGLLAEDQEILVIPSLNPYSMNIKKRFWPTDNTDINRMFPGYALGETTQRIAAGVFEVISEYRCGIQFASFYMPGRFLPHVNIMRTELDETDKAAEFGMPYIMVREPRPFDTTTLNYNWQIWDTEAYSLYSTTTNQLDEKSAEAAVDSVVRFMMSEGLVEGEKPPIEESRILLTDELVSVRSMKAGIFSQLAEVGDKVEKDQPIARIIDVYEGEVLEEIKAPCKGIIFFRHDEALTYANAAVFKLIPID